MNLLQICYEFFKTGLFAIGGGLATLPFLSRMGERFGWFTQEELANMLAVSESTPGPIGINMSTYVGTVLEGLPGAILATFSLVLPSYIIILLIAKMIRKFQGNLYVQNSMQVLRPASVGMICAALLGVIVTVFLDPAAIAEHQFLQAVQLPQLILFAILLPFYWKYHKLHPVVILAIGAAAGILFQL